MAPTLYIHAEPSSEDLIYVDLEMLLVLNIFKLCDTGRVRLDMIQKKSVQSPTLQTRSGVMKTLGDDCTNPPEIITNVKLPALVLDVQGIQYVVAGICAIARQLVKYSGDTSMLSLLGFRESCLAACSESSIWTKFCEVDVVATVRNVFTNISGGSSAKLILADDLIRFEYHMQQPVRMHNVYNIARKTKNDKSIKSTIPIAELDVPHSYSEGPAITLSDVILLPSMEILKRFRYSDEIFRDVLPLTYQWMERMREFAGYANLVEFGFRDLVNETLDSVPWPMLVEINKDIKKESLYSSDPNRYKPINRIYTKQDDINSVLNHIHSSLSPIIESTTACYGAEVLLDWDGIPMILRPEGGALPKKRSRRKEEQLENLAKAVIKLVRSYSTSAAPKNRKIVDFCSGSGHLGLLLAYLLPECIIILVENKERSLERALDRIKTLQMTNVIAVQSNLDYFQGAFDIGVSLHACGVATDLVMQKCIVNKAHFVCCPCCYGGIHDCYHLKFPRSVQFAEKLPVEGYLKIAHAADQTHDKENAKTPQGYHCMDIIDTDRLLYAKCAGYETHLSKLQPETCTPKNNLLVGIYSDR